jgi:subtilisin family serine protease
MLGIFVVLVCTAVLAVGPLRGSALLGGSPIQGESVIVVLKDGAGVSELVAGSHARLLGLGITHVYGSALSGYAATVPAGAIDTLRALPEVAYIAPDLPMHATQLVPPIFRTPSPPPPPPQSVPWGIDRVGADTSSTLAGNGSGAITNVNAYVLDTGIASHSDLNVVGRVNFISDNLLGLGGNNGNTDCNGHGTHVAGTIAARDNSTFVVGVAPGAPLTAVRVLGCGGSGATSAVIAGVDWVTANAVKPAVANMSLNGGVNQALDDAVRRSAASGVFYAIAAGNSGADACNESPARSGAGVNNGIMTTAATDITEAEASFSNFGACVDVWAPGVNVVSTSRTGGTTTLSGTSMSSPHVAGGGALRLSSAPTMSPTSVEADLRSRAQSTGTFSKNGAPVRREFVGTL